MAQRSPGRKGLTGAAVCSISPPTSFVTLDDVCERRAAARPLFCWTRGAPGPGAERPNAQQDGGGRPTPGASRLSGEYTLEVSTPGVDRPLTRLKDFETFEGHEARLELDRMAEGRKRFRGELAGVEGDQVAINLEGEAETALVPFAWITEAKLILTDRLMERGAQERARRLAGGSHSDSDQEDLP